MLPGKAPARWIHVAYTGEKVYDGEPLTLTEQHFDQFIRNFDSQKNAIPVYLNHEMAQAEGWVLDLKREGSDLLANMEFGKDVAEDIRAGKWGFTSIGFSLESVSRDNGKPIGAELMEISLTNEPFLDGCVPVSLSRNKGRRYVQMSTTPRDLIQKHLKEGGSLSDFESALASIKDGGSDDAPAADPAADIAANNPAAEPDAQLQEGADEALAAGGEIAALLMEATGLGPAEVLAAIRDNLDAIASAIGATSNDEGTPADVAANRDTEGDVKMTQRTEALEIRLKAMEAELKTLKARDAQRLEDDLAGEVDSMVTDGKILPSDRDKTLELLRKSPEETRAVLSDRQVVPVGDAAPVEKKHDPGTVTYADLNSRQRRQVDNMFRGSRSRLTKDQWASRLVETMQRRQAQGAN